MKRTLTSLLAGIVTAGLLAATPAPATADGARYNADGAWKGGRYCANVTKGVTARKVLLDNRRSNRRVQFKIVRDNGADGDTTRYVWVKPGRTATVIATVHHGKTSSVRVRVPEMGRGNLVFSATLTAIGTCWTPVRDPRASLTTQCVGKDTLALVQFDNRRGDYAEGYSWTFGNNDGAASEGAVNVAAGKSNRQAWLIPAGSTASVVVQAADSNVYENRTIEARDCI